MLRAVVTRAGRRVSACASRRAIATTSDDARVGDVGSVRARASGGTRGMEVDRWESGGGSSGGTDGAWASGVDAGWIADGGVGSRVLEMWLMAVPKRKVTPSRRKRRNQFKRLPFIESVVRCPACGKVNLPHVRCCFVDGEGGRRRTGRGEGVDGE